MSADFAFAVDATPAHDEMQALYAHILGPAKAKPTVSLGAISRAEAESWLVARHAHYIQEIGSRSGLLKKMYLPDRVDLVDLVGEPS